MSLKRTWCSTANDNEFREAAGAYCLLTAILINSSVLYGSPGNEKVCVSVILSIPLFLLHQYNIRERIEIFLNVSSVPYYLFESQPTELR